MANVDILFKGYSPSGNTKGHACSTAALVEDGDLKIVTDPGTVPDPAILIEALKERDLSTDDIDIVFITHSHFDHYKYVGLFPKAEVLEYWGRWKGDLWRESDGVINDRIKAVNTPGHSADSMTLLVETERGTVAICGDVFWDKDFPLDDPLAEDKPLLKETRKKLLEIADFIVPGHGDIFKVEAKPHPRETGDRDRSSGE